MKSKQQHFTIIRGKEFYERIRRAKRKLGKSISEIVRDGVDQYLKAYGL